MGKYSPLKSFLTNAPSNQTTINLSFTQIEEIIGDSLPMSAVKHQAWWANELGGSHTQAHAWLEAGFSVEHVHQNPERGYVRFIRKSHRAG